jgi:Ca2+-binding EF-hand superfamily protein
MSKQECQKYHQKCVGEMSMSFGENKVGEIYENYDTDKDGFLTLDDFLKFYEKSIKSRESTVWSNL